MALGYPQQMFANGYYTARVLSEIGVCVSPIPDTIFMQFFPWGMRTASLPNPTTGHDYYCNFIVNNVLSLHSKYDGMPYYKLPLESDILTIKCLIEEGINQCETLPKSP